MNPFGISARSYELIREAFKDYPEVEDVVVFGSRAKGNFKKGSDIDLALKGKNCNDKMAMDINAFLNEALPIPYYVDVLFYDGVDNPDLRDHIDRVGKSLFSNEYIN